MAGAGWGEGILGQAWSQLDPEDRGRPGEEIRAWQSGGEGVSATRPEGKRQPPFQ